jgi:hypothetical protein
LIRSWRNTLAPINRVPPELLALIPDFWSSYGRDKSTIALTHVSKAWREIFTSRSSLWTDFHCADAEKTRAYLERSKSSPISLELRREDGLFLHDPFFQIAPHAVNRLKDLFLSTDLDYLKDITDRLSRSAPILENLRIFGSANDPFSTPVLPVTIFNGDLSSLRNLELFSVRTQLPWRNMINLTSFSLGYVIEPSVSVGQLLDFFEGAPRLLEVELAFATPSTGAQNGRLVSLAHLRRLSIYGWPPPSLLFDHLLIPEGAKMRTNLDLPGPRIEDHLPRSLDNFRNLSNFTKIRLHFEHIDHSHVSIKLSGPNGQICMVSMSPNAETTLLVPRSLAVFDASKITSLEILNSDPLSEDLHQALLSMNGLRSLRLSLCKDLRSFILALGHDLNSMDPIPCPKLERLVFRTEERFDIERMVEVASARASGGAPFKSVKIVNRRELVPRAGVTELLKHVLRVENLFEIRGEVHSCHDSDDEDCDGGEEDCDGGEEDCDDGEEDCGGDEEGCNSNEEG